MTKLNIQGLSRQFKPLMECLIPDEGKVFVSIDLSAGEPTVTTHFSKDPNYYNATFNMVGKEPYYDDNNVLQIDDIYLMGASVSPMGKDVIREIFEQGYNEQAFLDIWKQDKEIIQKKWLKSSRAFHKILILGLGYSMGPKKMVKSAYEKGFTLSIKEAKAFFNAYWDVLFPKLKVLRDQLESVAIKQGYLENPFGYRLYPEPSYKALNYFIQSTVSGIMNALCIKFFHICPEAEYITTIHDEIIIQIPLNMVDECKSKMDMAVDSLNQDLQWDVNIRTGWAVGKNLYEAK